MITARWIAILGAMTLLPAQGCGPDRGGAVTTSHDPGASVLPANEVSFTDIAREAGVVLVTVCGNSPRKDYLLESTGTGVAVADYDGDGDEDIYLPTAQTTADWMAGRAPRANALYRNNGDGTFTNVAAQAGVALRAWSSGAYFVDYDNDDDKDLFVTAWGNNVLYRSNGDGTFTDATRGSGLDGPRGWSTSAAFGDLDGDGDLDLYVARYCQFDPSTLPLGGRKTVWKGTLVFTGPQGFAGEPDILYRNNGDGTFTDATRESGIDDDSVSRYGLGVVLSDVDGDGDLDVYTVNDSTINYLWRNDGGLHFSDFGAIAGLATNEDALRQGCRGTDSGDYNGDGLMDLVASSFSHEFNTLYRNRGGVFADATFEAGLQDSYSKLSWGTKFFDYDNDGAVDVCAANGHVYPEVDDQPQLNTPYRQANSLYRNRGDGTFESRSREAGPGLDVEESSRGLAVADLDRDGDLDLVVTNIDAAPSVLRNEGGNRLSWISLRLVGMESNRDAVGARVELEAGGRSQVREVNPFGSYQSQSTYRVHFGLGRAETVERIRVRWPSGRIEELWDIPARRFVTLTEGHGISGSEEPAAEPAP